MEHLIGLLQFLGGIALFSAYALILFITGFALAATVNAIIPHYGSFVKWIQKGLITK